MVLTVGCVDKLRNGFFCISGKLHDYTRTYMATFYLSVAALILMILLSVIALIVTSKQERQPYEHLEKSSIQKAP